jgi:hypothetical protein
MWPTIIFKNAFGIALIAIRAFMFAILVVLVMGLLDFGLSSYKGLIRSFVTSCASLLPA